MRPSPAVLIAALSLTACAGTRTTAAPTPTPTLAVEVASESRAFSSPSKNIGCYLDAEAARCEISSHTWKLTARPADCEYDWIAGFTLSTTDAADGPGLCASDTAAGGPVMAYGRAVRIGDLQCASLVTGVECSHLTTHHGFRVSRESYRVL